jgi:hypothetical protein
VPPRRPPDTGPKEQPALKFQPDTLDGVNNASPATTPAASWVGPTAFTHSLLVPWQGEVQPWAVRPPSTTCRPTHFERLLALQPELVIFGSGARMRFAPPALLRR